MDVATQQAASAVAAANANAASGSGDETITTIVQTSATKDSHKMFVFLFRRVHAVPCI